MAGTTLFVPLAIMLTQVRQPADFGFVGGSLLAGPVALFATTWRMLRRSDHPMLLFVLSLIVSWPVFLMVMTLAAFGAADWVFEGLLVGSIASVLGIPFAALAAWVSRRHGDAANSSVTA